MVETPIVGTNQLLFLSGVDLCTTWLGALVVIVVALVSVRAAHKQSALIAAGGGLLLLVTACCLNWSQLYFEVDYPDEGLLQLSQASSVLGILLRLVALAMMIAAAALLAVRLEKGGA